jgi:hypothetical protein
VTDIPGTATVTAEPVTGLLNTSTAGLRRSGSALPPGHDADLSRLLTAATNKLSRTEIAVLPVVLSAASFARRQITAFAERCHDPDRRLRPSFSLGLEASRLVAPFTRAGWQGRCHVLVSPGDTFAQAMRCATVALAAGATAAAVADLEPLDDHRYRASVHLLLHHWRNR